MVVLFIAAGYWVATGNQSSLFVAAAMGLIGLGAYQGVRVSVEQAIRDEERHR
jgi:hypothetical protein